LDGHSLEDVSKKFGIGYGGVNKRMNEWGVVERSGWSGRWGNKKFIGKKELIFSNPFNNALKKYGLLNNKHIPMDYKVNSEEVRLKILAGLIDTDGYVTNNCVEIIQKNENLARDIVYVARSLGFAASIVKCKKGIKSRNFVGEYWRIFLSGDVWRIPCLVERKKKLMRERRQIKNVLNTGISLKKLDVGDYFGFEIDGNHRYLLGDFTVTHNTFQADVFGYLMGTTLHNMEQSTLKGLVFSHQGDSAKSGFGQKGILLRERYVALLNEFLRVVVRSQQKAAHKDEMSRLFATLNDAVERKKNRSRSSGNVVDAEGYCSCSMLTTDNDFPHLIGPFAHTMLEDPSYLRRYSILRLSDETETRGEFAKVGVFDWQSALTHHLASKGLAGGRWARLMRFWRSQVPVALKKFDYLNIARYAKVKKKMLLRKWFYGDREPVSFGGVDQTAILYQTVMQADFSQLAVSCQASAIIMGSTFRSKGSYPELTRTHDDDVLATRMITRLMEDLFKVIGPYIAEHIQMNEGVRRI
jgi:hypothetical protein